METTLNRRIDNLSLDHRRGAAHIVEDSALILKDIARFGEECPEAAELIWRRAVYRLAHNHPTMAPMLKLLNRACLALDEEERDWPNVAGRVSDLLVEHRAHMERMAYTAIDTVASIRTLITFSFSSTVASVIIACHEQGWGGKVLLGESRPLMEGVLLAKTICGAGVPTTLMTDAALMSSVSSADAVWVGGDCFNRQGMVNKVGTKALLEIAQAHSIPVTVMLATDKLLPSALTPYYHFTSYNSREVTTEEVEGLTITNQYFEDIPHNLIDRVYTEWGILTVEEAIARIEEEEVSTTFDAILKAK